MVREASIKVMTSRTYEVSVKVVHVTSSFLHSSSSSFIAHLRATRLAIMPPFATRPLNSTKSHPIFAQIRRHPFILFGIPFIGIIVGSSFALQAFTQTRYDYQETKVKSVGKEEELGMKSGRRKIDLKEEYYVRFYYFIFFLCKGKSLIGSIETKQSNG